MFQQTLLASVLCDQTLLVPVRTSGGREGRSRACISTAAAFSYEDDPFEVVLMLKPMPKGVFIGIDELAGITGFLLTPAARNITGQAIVVDGGWTSQ